MEPIAPPPAHSPRSAHSLPVAPAATPAPDSGSGRTIRRLRIALGTWVAIEGHAATAATALAGIEAAFAAVTDVEQRMHPTRAQSDIAQINTSAPGKRVSIHPTSWFVLSLAQRVHALSDGVFDPCLPATPGRLSDLELSARPGRAAPWARCHAPLALDLGGIAKGYAIDCAIDAMTAAGCDAGLVNAGGDLRVFGARHEAILLRTPRGTYKPLRLTNTALAVSDLDATRRPAEHRGYYLRRVAARPRHRQAAVLAPSAVAADALTKCVLLCSPERARSVLQEFAARSAV